MNAERPIVTENVRRHTPGYNYLRLSRAAFEPLGFEPGRTVEITVDEQGRLVLRLVEE